MLWVWPLFPLHSRSAFPVCLTSSLLSELIPPNFTAHCEINKEGGIYHIFNGAWSNVGGAKSEDGGAGGGVGWKSRASPCSPLSHHMTSHGPDLVKVCRRKNCQKTSLHTLINDEADLLRGCNESLKCFSLNEDVDAGVPNRAHKMLGGEDANIKLFSRPAVIYQNWNWLCLLSSFRRSTFGSWKFHSSWTHLIQQMQHFGPDTFLPISTLQN